MNNKTYLIMGKYRGKTEQLDTATGEAEANYLVGEYRMAFGSEWVIWKELSIEEVQVS